MRWCKIDGKGLWHYAKYSLNGPTHAKTVCGRSGLLEPTTEDGPQGRACAECSEFVNG